MNHIIKQSTGRTVDVSAAVSDECDASTNVRNWKVKCFYLLAIKDFNWENHGLLIDKKYSGGGKEEAADQQAQ